MGNELLGGRYRLQEVLGSGGMASVWRAWDTRLSRPVAVKTLHGELREPSAAARFDREARTVARLSHPNIVSVYDRGTQDGTDYIVMEQVDGVTVASMLAEGPLPVDRAVSIARQTADALGAAHATGVVHRDVKPANIMVTPAGIVKVCDFGIAREVRAPEATLTAPQTTIGTAAYMAPEQAAGEPVDARTDLYALGCVMYAMLTGTPPFTGDGAIEVLYQQLHKFPLPVRSRRAEVPPALDALVLSLLAKNPADRPADAAAVRAALNHPYAPVTALAGESGALAVVHGAPPSPGTTRPMAAIAAVPVPVRPARADEPGWPDESGWYPAGPTRRGRRLILPVLAAVATALIATAFLVTLLLGHQSHGPRTPLQPATRASTTQGPRTTTSGSTTRPAPTPTPAPTTTGPAATSTPAPTTTTPATSPTATPTATTPTALPTPTVTIPGSIAPAPRPTTPTRGPAPSASPTTGSTSGSAPAG